MAITNTELSEQYLLQLLSQPSSLGSVYTQGGVMVGLTVFKKVASGELTTIEATPIEGNRFREWYNPSTGTTVSTSSKFSLEINSDLTLWAIFERIPVTVPQFADLQPITTETAPKVETATESLPIVQVTTTSAPLATATVTGNIRILITRMAPAIKAVPKIKIRISPAATPSQQKELLYPFQVKVLPINVNISQPLITVAYQFLNTAITNYIDEERELKTLVNYGEDRQSVALAWRYNSDRSGMQLKLLQPVPNDVDINSTLFLSREVAKSLVDKVRIRFAPPIDATPYLRPRNTYVQSNIELGKSLKNVTLNLLQLRTGSQGGTDQYKNISFEDQIFRQWYSYDFNSAELNIDFTNYNNFVFYGSAAMRLAAFREKLKLIEKLDSQQLQFVTQSITGSSTLVGRLLLQEESAKLSKQKEDIIRGFDRYEQFLYFTPSGSDKSYTASAYYADYGNEYNSLAYWPKTGSNLYPAYSDAAQEWFNTQYAIAQRFDDFNENNLINTIPMHVREDEDSASYITFVTMIGHFFDLIKPYIDQMEYIYDRDIDPNVGLSKDLVNEIAESLGFKLPTINSVYNLSNTILGTEQYEPRRDYTVETYKRLLHNLPFFAKAKGTRTALHTLINSLGITPQLINVKESGTPTGSYYVFDEFSNGIDFDEDNPKYISVPLLKSLRNPRSLQFNFTVAKPKTMTILTGDDKWALRAYRHPTIEKLGRIELTSGSNHAVILSSSYGEIFGDELLNVAIQTSGSSAKMYVMQVYAEDILFYSEASESVGANKFVPLWNATDFAYIGGSGSLVTSPFDGTVDEFRLWGINLSEEMVLNTAFDPGSNAGDTYEDPVNYLYVQLSFNTIDTGSLPILQNESPYKNINAFPPLIEISTKTIVASDFSRYNRTVRQLVPEAGSSGYLTTKVKVASPPVFNTDSIDRDGNKILSRTKSIVRPEMKKLQIGRNKVIVSMSPTQIINQNIIRNLGLENINAVLGAPTDLYYTFDKTLDMLKTYYQRYYYVNVNFNRYIRIVSELGSILDQTLDYFIPSRATLLKGVVIEPNVLERVKIRPIKNLRVYGKNTRRTITAPGSRTGSHADFAATYNLSEKIGITDQVAVRAKYPVYQTQHEDWYPALLISQSGKPSRDVAIPPVNTAFYSTNQTYDTQHENWYTELLISQSLKLKRKSRIDIQDSQKNGITGTDQTYFVQHESWYNNLLISQSIKLKRQSFIADTTKNTLAASQQTYDVQHEDWYQALLISKSLHTKTKVSIQPIRDFNINGSNLLYSFQHENWYDSILVSQSLKPKRMVRITDDSDYILKNSSYSTYGDQHFSLLDAPPEESKLIHRPSRIQVYQSTYNKVPFDDAYKGSEGAEPYSRVYTRKLTDSELRLIRPYYDTNPEIPQDKKVTLGSALKEIPPIADFRDGGVTTYFNSPVGIYSFRQIFKRPVYREPLNLQWDDDNQEFIGITSWSYGTRYNQNDVVYQDVSTQYISTNEIPSSSLIRSNIQFENDKKSKIRAGNKQYYVFTTKPAYRAPTDGTSFYSGSVPSYAPPSIDNDNWERLLFKPTEKTIQKRVVYDVFTYPDPQTTNYKITTVDVDRITTYPARFIDTINVLSISGNSYVFGEISIQNIMNLFAIQQNVDGLRLRLYRTSSQRIGDLSRTRDSRPEPSAGVLLDVILSGTTLPQLINPVITMVSDSNPLDGVIYYTIDNLSSDSKSNIIIDLFYFGLQIQPKIPVGYLKKHYKFFRDNSTATKRRNYLGCKFSIVGYSSNGRPVWDTIDGLPPVQIFLSEGTQITVSETQLNNEITTGRGGALDVT